MFDLPIRVSVTLRKEPRDVIVHNITTKTTKNTKTSGRVVGKVEEAERQGDKKEKLRLCHRPHCAWCLKKESGMKT